MFIIGLYLVVFCKTNLVAAIIVGIHDYKGICFIDMFNLQHITMMAAGGDVVNMDNDFLFKPPLSMTELPAVLQLLLFDPRV